jgi:hypothetical protein
MRALPQNIMDKGISELFSKGKEAWSRSMAWWTGSKKAVHGGRGAPDCSRPSICGSAVGI